MTVSRSPAGYTLVHVISDGWGPFVDIRASYLSLARRRPWVLVITPDEFRARQNKWLWNDPQTVFVLWELIDPGPLHQRRCRVVHVYAEAIDSDLNKMLPQHVAYWDRFRTMTVHFDAVLVHTPFMAELVSPFVSAPVFVMPVGWDAETMGAPRWESPKHRNYLFHGSMCGRREVFVPYLAGPFGLGDRMFHDVTGVFGRSLLGQLDTALASLYIAHSSVASFSTWRLWQVASTSAALVAEPGDAWPFVAGEHYVAIDPIDPNNAAAVVQYLRDVACDLHHLRDVAKAAHEVVREFTMEHVEDTYLVPMIERINAP